MKWFKVNRVLFAELIPYIKSPLVCWVFLGSGRTGLWGELICEELWLCNKGKVKNYYKERFQFLFVQQLFDKLLNTYRRYINCPYSQLLFSSWCFSFRGRLKPLGRRWHTFLSAGKPLQYLVCLRPRPETRTGWEKVLFLYLKSEWPSQVKDVLRVHYVLNTQYVERYMCYISSLQLMSAMGQVCQCFTVRYRMSTWGK